MRYAEHDRAQEFLEVLAACDMVHGSLWAADEGCLERSRTRIDDGRAGLCYYIIGIAREGFARQEERLVEFVLNTRSRRDDDLVVALRHLSCCLKHNR